MNKVIEYFDTHAHIHFPDYPYDPVKTWQEAQAAGVTRMLAVGCRLGDSQAAVKLAQAHNGIWAVVGIHPHEAAEFLAVDAAKSEFTTLLSQDKVVAIGEIGLDYFYNHSPKEQQIEVLHWQLQLAQNHNLPVVFHVREAFEDFWPIFDQYTLKTSLIHSFTGSVGDLEQILARDLLVAQNGIMTFTKDEEQLTAARMIPLDRLVIETDAPFLTPKPLRGKICKPEHVKLTAAFLAELRHEPLEQFASQTTQNARVLFNV